MKYVYRFFILCSFLLGNSDQYVLMISFDGFRADYLDWYDTPNFDKLAEQGVKAKGMKPIYVSKTFPNHYSLATGMYAENHGLIANTFYDEKFDATYKIIDRSAVEDERWYGGEPIWCTAEKQDVKTASYFWVGSESNAGGCQPTNWKRYDHDFPFESRIDSVIGWFNKPEEDRPQLVLLYFHEPDNIGHRYGPKSEQTKKKVKELDTLLGQILEKCKTLDIYEKLNILALSDHGMTETSPKRAVRLSDHIDMSEITQEESGAFSFLYGPDQDKLKEIVTKLNQVPHITAYLKNDIPDRFHYRSHYRIKDVLVIADDEWSIINEKYFNPDWPSGGDHGYDNFLWSMHAIFVADGPAFKDGYQFGTFNNIDIYPLIAKILEIEPHPDIDGNLINIRAALKEE